ncbi:helix-turn-helix domain-containing protein [Vagococcus silagei]|nr:XRE family transcriptional regulator [Vagococcus silagei]
MVMNDDLTLINQMGKNLRDLRKNKGLTMEQLANLSGVSGITISNLENGRSNPTINVLWKLAEALDITLTQLVGYAQPTTEVSKLETTHFISDLATGWLIQPVFQEDKIDVFRVCLKAKATHQERHQSKNTTEVITVMKGSLLLKVGNQTYRLDEYDSINFDSGLAHDYINDTNEDILLNIVVKY